MKLERTKNASRNIVFGVIQKLYQIIIPFLLRTAMIHFMGVQYLGIDSLFASILQVLNLAELGVGSAMVYSMYKPIVDDDTTTICALMRLYRTYYRVIGAVIAVVGIALTPFIPKLVKSDLPSELNIYILYWLNLAATVLSYWLFAYKNSLFSAYQRIDIPSKVSLVTSTFRYAVQFFVIFVIKNYYIYVIAVLAGQALTNVITAIAATKMYPELKPVGKLQPEVVHGINKRIRDLFTAKIGSVVVNSVDTVVISAFLGLTVLAVYQNYFYILTSVIGIVGIVFNSCTAGIGNSVIVDTKEKIYEDLKKFTFIIVWISGFCTCCFLCLYQPFMKIWVGEDLMLNFGAVICLCIYYFIYEFNQLLWTYKDASGIWYQDRFRPLVTALSNLAMNLIMVQFFGIYGVLLSTVISFLFVGTPWLIHNLFTFIFDKKYMRKYLKQLLVYSTVVFIACIICYYLCSFVQLSDWSTLIVRGIICCIVPNTLFLLIYHKSSEFVQSVRLLDRITKYKFHLYDRFKLNINNKI